MGPWCGSRCRPGGGRDGGLRCRRTRKDAPSSPRRGSPLSVWRRERREANATKTNPMLWLEPWLTNSERSEAELADNSPAGRRQVRPQQARAMSDAAAQPLLPQGKLLPLGSGATIANSWRCIAARSARMLRGQLHHRHPHCSPRLLRFSPRHVIGAKRPHHAALAMRRAVASCRCRCRVGED